MSSNESSTDFFQKYSTIKHPEGDEDLLLKCPLGQPYFVEEKIHGANFCFIVTDPSDKVPVLGSRRKDILKPDDPFFNHQTLHAKYDGDARHIYVKVAQLLKLDSQSQAKLTIRIYGELFGGVFYTGEIDPNNSKKAVVKTKPSAIRVQHDIYYHPENEFIPFDIQWSYVKNTDKNEEENIMSDYLSIEERIRLISETGFKQIPVLFKGSLKECLAYPYRFMTKIPDLFGLTMPGCVLEQESNLAEGVVIKPNQASYFPTGSRVIFKQKIDEFSEFKPKKSGVKKALKSAPDSADYQKALEIMEGHFNQNRLNSVMSKETTQLTSKTVGKYIGLICQDVHEDLAQYQPIEKAGLILSEDEQKTLKKNYAILARRVILEYLQCL